MTTFLANLSDVHPSQLYVCESKLLATQREFQSNSVAPIPLKLLAGLTICTDGHTRALAAHLAGRKQVPAVWEQDDLDWEAYEICVRWCREESITSIAALAERVVDEQTYERLWLARCRAMHQELDRKRGIGG